MRPTFYANAVQVQPTPTEVILDCKIKATGKPSESCRVILPLETACKLGVLLGQLMERGDDAGDSDQA